MHILVTYAVSAVIAAIMVGMVVASYRNDNCQAVLGWAIAVIIFIVHFIFHVS